MQKLLSRFFPSSARLFCSGKITSPMSFHSVTQYFLLVRCLNDELTARRRFLQEQAVAHARRNRRENFQNKPNWPRLRNVNIPVKPRSRLTGRTARVSRCEISRRVVPNRRSRRPGLPRRLGLQYTGATINRGQQRIREIVRTQKVCDFLPLNCPPNITIPCRSPSGLNLAMPTALLQARQCPCTPFRSSSRP